MRASLVDEIDIPVELVESVSAPGREETLIAAGNTKDHRGRAFVAAECLKLFFIKEEE